MRGANYVPSYAQNDVQTWMEYDAKVVDRELGYAKIVNIAGSTLGAPDAAATVTRADEPLVADRLVFNWHNFLSSCSTWNLTDWNRWTDDARQLGYNGIMVHAYGNNPMVSFEFNGQTKPVGFLSTTVKGRDWSTMHVNDVRRLVGGAAFGDQPVFGADAARVPDEQRVEAARKLMQGVFAHAAGRGMQVVLANDVDTDSANPQALIRTLPASARFAMSGSVWLTNPETPEGFAYYKAQVAALLKDYPQITTLVVWFRTDSTPWINLKLTEMPAAWQEEYQAALAKQPQVAKYWRAPNMLAIGKIVRAYQRALKELGRDRVRLAAGTWKFDFLPGADVFFPPGVTFIGLDYDVLHNRSMLATAQRRQKLAEVGAHRPLIPVIWAQHDDGTYFGRPYTPFDNFHTKLVESKASGFGVIHWMTRPFDLFFASHIRQVGKQTQNESLRVTCEQVGGQAMGEYLYRWITEAPQFGRETSDYFIDRPLTGVPAIVAGCRQRLTLLKNVTGAASRLLQGAGIIRGLVLRNARSLPAFAGRSQKPRPRPSTGTDDPVSPRAGHRTIRQVQFQRRHHARRTRVARLAEPPLAHPHRSPSSGARHGAGTNQIRPDATRHARPKPRRVHVSLRRRPHGLGSLGRNGMPRPHVHRPGRSRGTCPHGNRHRQAAEFHLAADHGRGQPQHEPTVVLAGRHLPASVVRHGHRRLHREGGRHGASSRTLPARRTDVPRDARPTRHGERDGHTRQGRRRAPLWRRAGMREMTNRKPART